VGYFLWQNSIIHLRQLSGFPNLYVLYSILCCLPVSSASAEKALSKMKIIKNRLRSTLSDDTMSALMIMAAESDLLQNISNADIIKRMAITTYKPISPLSPVVLSAFFFAFMFLTFASLMLLVY